MKRLDRAEEGIDRQLHKKWPEEGETQCQRLLLTTCSMIILSANDGCASLNILSNYSTHLGLL